MASKDTDCKMMDLSIAIASLLLYIKRNTSYCKLHLNVLSKKVEEEVRKQIRQNESLHEQVKEVTDDLENYKFQLHYASKSKEDKEDLEFELEEVSYEIKWESTFKVIKSLIEKAEQLEMNNSVLRDRHIEDIERLGIATVNDIQLRTTERTCLKSYISDLEIKTKEYQDKIIEMKLTHEQEVQKMERKMHQLQVHLQENMKLITKQNEVITSSKMKIKDQHAEIDHLLENIRDMKVKYDFLTQIEHGTSKDRNMSKLKETIVESSREISDDTEAELGETKTRLRKAMRDRTRENDPNVTDLSDRNRPTKLAEKCSELYENQWRTAFEILYKYNLDDEAVIESLLHILQAAMTFCEDKTKFQIEELGRVIIFADTHVSANLPLGVQKQLKNTRQTMALSAVENLRKMFISYLSQSTDQTMQKALEIKEFTFACLELCWFMMVNNPPVAFAPVHAKGSDFNSDLYKPYSYDGTHIDYVVWPALLLHEGGPVLVKGVAQGYNT